jgi:hypothetical protein
MRSSAKRVASRGERFNTLSATWKFWHPMGAFAKPATPKRGSSRDGSIVRPTLSLDA